MADFSGQPDPFAIPPMDPLLEQELAQQGAIAIPEDMPWPPWTDDELADVYMHGPRGSNTLALGGMPPIEETAAPTPAAIAVPAPAPAPAPMQPGLSIPASVVDQAAAAPAPEIEDPWAPTSGPSLVDPERAQGYAERVGDLGEEIYGAHLRSDPLALWEAQQKFIDERDAVAREGVERIREEDAASQALIQQRRDDALAKHQADMQQLDRDWRALAATKVDPDRWFASRSTGQKIAAVLSAVVGGLAAGRSGGPNVGLQMIQHAIDADIEAQKADLHTRQQGLYARKGALADAFKMTGDEHQAAVATRLASYEKAIQQLQTDMNQYDPAGRQFLERQQMIMQIAGLQQKSIAEFNRQRLEEALDHANLQGKLLDNASKQRRLAGGGGAPAPMFSEDAFKSVVPPPGWKGTQKQWLEQRNTYLQGRKHEQDIEGGGTVGQEQRQEQRERTGMGLYDVDANGQPLKDEFIPKGTAEEVKKLRAQKAGTQEMVNLLDQAMSIRTGWTSDTVGSDENKKLKAIMGKLKLAAKKTEDLGAITESDADLIEGLVGTDDFTEWRGVEAAVGQARRNLIDSLRISTSTHGMSAAGAARIDFPNLYEHKVKKSQADSALQSLLSGEADKDAAMATLRQIGADAQSKDAEVRDAALAKLRQIAKEAPSDLIRRTAGAWAERKPQDSSSDTVKMIGDDGTVYDVPRDQVEAAKLSRGLKPLTYSGGQ